MSTRQHFQRVCLVPYLLLHCTWSFSAASTSYETCEDNSCHEMPRAEVASALLQVSRTSSENGSVASKGFTDALAYLFTDSSKVDTSPKQGYKSSSEDKSWKKTSDESKKAGKGKEKKDGRDSKYVSAKKWSSDKSGSDKSSSDKSSSDKSSSDKSSSDKSSSEKSDGADKKKGAKKDTDPKKDAEKVAKQDTKKDADPKPTTADTIQEALEKQKEYTAQMGLVKKIQTDRLVMERITKEKQEAAREAVAKLKNLTSTAEKESAKVLKAKEAAEKAATDNLEKAKVALEKASEEKTKADKVAAEKTAAEREALQKFAVVDSITKQYVAMEADVKNLSGGWAPKSKWSKE